MLRLRKRAEFLAVRGGQRLSFSAFTLEAKERPADAGVAQKPAAERVARCGFTVTKKVGNAVVRNRVRRRLKEAVRLSTQSTPPPAADFVVIGRAEALRTPFARLKAEIGDGLARVLRAGDAARRRRPTGRTPG